MSWPYPRVVAHRGGGALAPENTLAAIRAGAALGFRGVEFDVMLAGDGTAVLIHDETLERTTGVTGAVAETAYATLQKLDIPRFGDAARLCRELGIWANVEIKPARGHERATGDAVARLAAELWRGAALPPLLSSFSVEALKAARAAVAGLPYGPLPYGLLVEEIPQNWKKLLQELGCVALHCNHEKLNRSQAEAVVKAGYGLLCYTVNEVIRARELVAWGVDCLVTDALRVIGPDFHALSQGQAHP